MAGGTKRERVHTIGKSNRRQSPLDLDSFTRARQLTTQTCHLFGSLVPRTAVLELQPQDGSMRFGGLLVDKSPFCSDVGHHPLDYDQEEYYPGRGLIDSPVQETRGDIQREPTPCYRQGEQYRRNLLRRAAPVAGGGAAARGPELRGPEQDPADEACIVGGKLVHKESKLPAKPRDVALLSEHYVAGVRQKAERAERALPQRLPKRRLEELLQNRKMVHQDELVDLICQELVSPDRNAPLESQEPVYAAAVRGASPRSTSNWTMSPPRTSGNSYDGRLGTAGPSSLHLVKADVEAYVASHKTNRDHELDVVSFLGSLYKPPAERKELERANDGLNRALRGHRPPRERPENGKVQRYENYWRARCMMEAVGDAMAFKESQNGGNLKPSRMFKRIDADGDGYISLSDLRTSCELLQIPHSTADLHALFSALDREDKGSVDIGEFTRHYEVHNGNLLDNMSKPVKTAPHSAGLGCDGPVQEHVHAGSRHRNHQAETTPPAGGGLLGVASPPATSSSRSQTATVEQRAGVGRSPTGCSRGGGGTPVVVHSPLVYESQHTLLAGQGTIGDTIRSRTSQWKPHKAQLYDTMPRTRFGMTDYNDTRHVVEPSVPLSGSFMSSGDRFKTTNRVMSVFAPPDWTHPQVEDALKKHTRGELRVERIRQRQLDFAERDRAAGEAARASAELRLARKALSRADYESRCQAAGA